MLIGTVAYMSPEQARSQDVDHRSDLFSFGVILHEMLTGRKPFAGPSAPETMSAIINEPAPRLPPGLASYQPILNRCLAKEAAARYQSAGDVADELRNIDRKESPRKRITPWALAAAGAVVLALVFFRPDRDATSDVPQLSNPTLVTRAEGVEDYPAWSPDGETIAYVASRNPNTFRASANWDIWVGQVRGQQPLNRTADHLGEDRFPSWSPDGSQIAFWSSRNDGGMYITPALAGAASTGRDPPRRSSGWRGRDRASLPASV
jgi:serine/threonine protein kinase